MESSILLLLNKPHVFALIQRSSHLGSIFKLFKFLNYINCKLKYQLVQVPSSECIYCII
jgi:hypothetical protein